MNHDFSVTFKPYTLGGPSMILESYSDAGKLMCEKINDAFQKQGLLMNEENFDKVIEQLGYL